MRTDIPCCACSWSSTRQHSCRYESHVKLVYGVSDRGVWSVGSKLILKERSNQPPDNEAPNIRLIQEKTTIPVPSIVEEWTESNGRHFTVMHRVPGTTLQAMWSKLSRDDKERIAVQTAESLQQLRQLHSHHLASVDMKPLYSAFLFPPDYGIPHGPFASDDDLWAELKKALRGVPEKACQRLRQRMPSTGPFTFTHGDLNSGNIMVENGNLTGILDWEASGYFPVWWEYTAAGIGLGSEDKEWKTILRKHMAPHEDARGFWLDFYSISKFPDLKPHGQALLEELLI
ncbi:kinase-like protein [Pseudovirgaria hyperparasitica]|uniref:Kinase-like protein n=1 Tax=Pseudovirgaria hyperparasitica TaxID=470096 RepID=A0A6A6VQ29_9PEZI|nr:kinase-like protein [Pseudovirgaria hyperparasitica]KAF2752748.1 kinase-like protein [Pseudovirgaria hyperparasitica]